MSQPKKAGQNQRPGVGNWERATNKQQRRLVTAYDKWGASVRSQILEAVKRGMPMTAIEAIINSRLNELEAGILDVVNKGVFSASRLSAGNSANLPEVLSKNQRMVLDNEKLVKGAFIPKAKESILSNIDKLRVVDRKTLVSAFAPMRSGVAQYSGGYWVAIFEVQKTLGQKQERETREPMKVRWVLDKAAEHCLDTAGFFGCPTLAGVYDSWDNLQTVPAGQVTCRGNCRCHLEVKKDGEWVRGVV